MRLRFAVREDTEDEHVKAAQRHAKEVHDIDLTAEQILAMAEPAA